MLIKIALNGARKKTESEFIPHSLSEIEKEVKAVLPKGYLTFHIHCYDKQGRESLKPEDVDSLVLMVRNISPEIQLGISSGDWIEPDPEKRINYIKNWKYLPDFISVNMIEENAVEIAGLLISRGILVEAGLNETKAAEIFVNSNLQKGCCIILIEPEEEEINPALKTVNDIEKVLNHNKINLKRLLHGFNSAAWDLLREAKKRGYDGRIGMEDTLYLEDGTKVKSNLEIIESAEKIINRQK